MVNKQIFQFPIIYSNPMGKMALGWGAHETVADECKVYNIKKALIVTTGLKGTGIIDEINGILNRNGVTTEIFDTITSNPKDREVMAAFKVFQEAKCDGVVSVGGGSSHDTGKGVRALAANPGRNINDFAAFIDPPWMEKQKEFKPITVPQVAVTTTAGTGAESTIFCAITNTTTRAKQIIMVPGAPPNTAIIDPLLIRTMPRNIAAWTGFDAMAHGFEAYVTRIQVPHSSGILLRLMKLVMENIREFTYNRMNHTACENMAYAASMGGVGIGFGAGAGIVHGIGHQLGALTDCHHGLANGVVCLAAERYNEPACPDRFAEMAKAMGVDTTGLTKMQAADRWFQEIERLLKDLNIQPGNLKKEFGLKEEDIPHIVKIYSNDFCSQGNPREFNVDEVLDLLKSLM